MPKRVWIVWGWRLISANLLLFPVADNLNTQFPFSFLLLFGADTLLILWLLGKYKSLQINLDNNKLTFSRGILLHRTIHIILNRSCATKIFASPLSRKFHLCNLIIYCEGARFFLPLTEENLANHITKPSRKATK